MAEQLRPFVALKAGSRYPALDVHEWVTEWLTEWLTEWFSKPDPLSTSVFAVFAELLTERLT